MPERDILEIELLKIKEELKGCKDKEDRGKALKEIYKRYHSSSNHQVTAHIKKHYKELLQIENETQT